MNFDRPEPWAFAAALLLTACAGGPSAPPAPDANTLIQQAQAALRGGSSRTLVVSGRGTGALFGQAWQPTVAWPGLNYSMLKRSYNLDTGAFSEEFGRSRAEPQGGGATPLMGQGEARAVGWARDGFAWNVAGTASSAAPVALPGRVNDLWTT